MGKKSSTVSFADITGGKKRNSIGRKKVKKAAKFHAHEMKISKKEFRKMNDDYEKGSLKKELKKYRRHHADELAEILLNGRLKNPDKYEGKLQNAIEDGKLFNSEKKRDMRKVARKNPALFAYTHIINPIDGEMVKSVLGGRVERLQEVMDEKQAVKVAPLAAKAEATKVLRVMIKVATEKDDPKFDAKTFFSGIRPKSVSKKVWKEAIVSTVFGTRGHPNNAMKDIVNYAIQVLGEMDKDRIKKLLRRYADSITKVSDSGEKLNFMINLKDLADVKRIEKVLVDNQKIASVIGQL